MKSNSSKVGAVELFYTLCSYVLAGLGGLVIGQWIVSMIDSTEPGVPGAILFIIVSGAVIMTHLAESEKNHRRSVKWYYHGPEPVLVK